MLPWWAYQSDYLLQKGRLLADFSSLLSLLAQPLEQQPVSLCLSGCYLSLKRLGLSGQSLNCRLLRVYYWSSCCYPCNTFDWYFGYSKYFSCCFGYSVVLHSIITSSCRSRWQRKNRADRPTITITVVPSYSILQLSMCVNSTKNITLLPNTTTPANTANIIITHLTDTLDATSIYLFLQTHIAYTAVSTDNTHTSKAATKISLSYSSILEYLARKYGCEHVLMIRVESVNPVKCLAARMATRERAEQKARQASIQPVINFRLICYSCMLSYNGLLQERE